MSAGWIALAYFAVGAAGAVATLPLKRRFGWLPNEAAWSWIALWACAWLPAAIALPCYLLLSRR
jgi:hypothetical protein